MKRKFTGIGLAISIIISLFVPFAGVSAADANKSKITIQYRDEENNEIKADAVFSETYVEGGTYTVPDEMKKNFSVKTDEGYNYYHFNEGKSQLTEPFAKEITLTLVFNNTDQYAYYEDFENYTLDLNKWHTGAGDLPVIAGDNSKYLSHSTGSSTTSGYMTFDEVDTTNKTVKITADVKILKHAGTGESQFTIGNTSPSFDSNKVNYGTSSGTNGHILHMAYAAKNGSFKVNGQSADVNFLGDWMHIEADVDFGSKDTVITLTNDSGKSEKIETKIFSSAFSNNLGSFYMRSGGTEGSVSLDNLTIKITGEATPAEPDIKSPLNYKSVYAFGDSIVYGHNLPGKSFMRTIANEYAMNLNMLAKNGATIIKSNNHILTQVKNAPNAAPDFVVFDGYTNDAYEETMSKLGTIQGSGATTFDNTTFCGAFEETLYTMKQKWPDSEIVFVTIHKSSGRDWDIQVKIRELSLAMCEAWGISVADVFNDTTLDTRNEEQLKKYIINGAGSHPNEAACREFYIPVIVKTIEDILNGSGGESTTEPTKEQVTKITADYNDDGSLKDVKIEQVNISEITDTVNTRTRKVFYWDSLQGMKPIASAAIRVN